MSWLLNTAHLPQREAKMAQLARRANCRMCPDYPIEQCRAGPRFADDENRRRIIWPGMLLVEPVLSEELLSRREQFDIASFVVRDGFAARGRTALERLAG